MRKVFLLLAALLAGIAGYGTYHDHRLDAQLEKVFPQERETQVQATMGTPSDVAKPCSAYGTAVIMGDCDHVLVYKSFFNALHARYWLVFVDNQGQTTATSRQNLP